MDSNWKTIRELDVDVQEWRKQHPLDVNQSEIPAYDEAYQNAASANTEEALITSTS